MPNQRDGAGRADMTAARSSRPFRPRLVPTLAMLVAVTFFVMAGNWQRGRMEMKESLRTGYDALAHVAPVPLSDLAVTGDWAAHRFRAVIAEGAYDADRQILLDNKVYGGRAGYEVVTPLKQDDGRSVLVNRG